MREIELIPWLIRVVVVAVVDAWSVDSVVADVVSAESRQRMRAVVLVLAAIAAMEVPMTTVERIQVGSVVAERILVEFAVVVEDCLVAEPVGVVDFLDGFAASSVHPAADRLAAEEQLESEQDEPLRLAGSVPKQIVVAHSAAVEEFDHPVLAADEVFHRLSLAEVDFSAYFDHCHRAGPLVVVDHLHLHLDSSSLSDEMDEKEKI